MCTTTSKKCLVKSDIKKLTNISTLWFLNIRNNEIEYFFVYI